MKVSELISKLEGMPQDQEVYIDGIEWEPIDRSFRKWRGFYFQRIK